jgi:uncharacterized protein YdhG (YjbR/CyaY superfamily)
MTDVKTVEEYIRNVPDEVRGKLELLRKVIIEAVPKQTIEKISYGMPFYEYQGRLVYFGLARNHIGLYIPPPIIEEHKQELKEYKTAKSAIQFPLKDDLPIDLIKKLIKARIVFNLSKKK